MLSQADKYPVLGAEAVWHFKQGLSEKVRTAIAGCSDEDLHAVAVQAKRVDAELKPPYIHCLLPASMSATIKTALQSAGAPARSVVLQEILQVPLLRRPETDGDWPFQGAHLIAYAITQEGLYQVCPVAKDKPSR